MSTQPARSGSAQAHRSVSPPSRRRPEESENAVLLVSDPSLVQQPFRPDQDEKFLIKFRYVHCKGGAFDVLVVEGEFRNIFFQRVPESALSSSILAHPSLLSAQVGDFKDDILASSLNPTRVSVHYLPPASPSAVRQVRVEVRVPITVHTASAVPSVRFLFTVSQSRVSPVDVMLRHLVGPLSAVVVAERLLSGVGVGGDRRHAHATATTPNGAAAVPDGSFASARGPQTLTQCVGRVCDSFGSAPGPDASRAVGDAEVWRKSVLDAARERISKSKNREGGDDDLNVSPSQTARVGGGVVDVLTQLCALTTAPLFLNPLLVHRTDSRSATTSALDAALRVGGGRTPLPEGLVGAAVSARSLLEEPVIYGLSEYEPDKSAPKATAAVAPSRVDGPSQQSDCTVPGAVGHTAAEEGGPVAADEEQEPATSAAPTKRPRTVDEVLEESVRQPHLARSHEREKKRRRAL